MRHRLSVLPLRLADDACFSAAGGLEFGCKDTHIFSISKINFYFFLFMFLFILITSVIYKKNTRWIRISYISSSFDGVFCIFLRDAVCGGKGA